MNELPWFIQEPNPDIYLSDRWISIDLETTNKNKGDAFVGGNSFVYGYYYSPLFGEGDINSEQELTELAEKLYQVDFIICHGSKFEIKWFKRCGIDISKLLFYDTLLGEYVIAGNRKFTLDLDSVAIRYGGRGKEPLVSNLIKSGVCPSTIPSSFLRLYCKQDVWQTIGVFYHQRWLLKSSGLLPVFFLRCLTTPVLADMESYGMFLDREKVYEIHRNCIDRHTEIVTRLDAITGGINMASPQQVARFLYTDLGFKELTDKRGNVIRGKPNKAFPEGQPLTDEDTILKLVCRTNQQREFVKLKLEESKLRKKITGYTNKFIEACENAECLIHGKFNQTISQTHRLTSSEPNLQNIDRSFKKAFKSRYKGWKVVNADYKTLEMTIAGLMAQDKQCLLDIRNKHDFHSYTASIVFDSEWIKAGSSRKTPEGDELRTESKPHTFKPLYGGTSGTKKEQAYYKAFRERYPDIDRMQRGWIDEVLRTGKLRTVSGLIFYWPDTAYTSSGYITNTSSISNYPIQMFATADIAPTGVALLWHYIKALKLQAFLINEVHDAMAGEVPPEEIELFNDTTVKVLTQEIIPFFKKVLDFDINFPIEIELKVGDTW